MRVCNKGNCVIYLAYLYITETTDLSNILTKWIVEVSKFWEKNEDIQPLPDVISLVFELASTVSKNEECFVQLTSTNSYLRLCDIFPVRIVSCPPQIKLAYVVLLKSFLQHRCDTR